MNELDRIRDQLQRAYDGAAWHGPPLRKLLTDVTAATAARKPIPGAHSIWTLVRHVSAWQRVVTRRLAGERIDALPPDEDFPPVVDPSESAWKTALEELASSHRQLAEAIIRLPEDRLDELAPGQKYSVYVMLHGVVQHNLYHAGQIAILKKLVG
jgi:hypothetical protein